MGIFKAYDVRGLVPEQLNPEIAEKIGVAFANLMLEETRDKRANPTLDHVRIGLGRDARPSGKELVPAFVRGMIRGGADVVDFGLCTTPMLYFGIGSQKLDAGVMATASHNPAAYNGFKFTREDAIPVSYDTGIAEVERRVTTGTLRAYPHEGTPLVAHDLTAAYHTFVLGFLRDPLASHPKVVVDTGNGMAGMYASLFDAFHIDVDSIYPDIDCTFPHHEANPIKPSNMAALSQAVRDQGADFGIGFDGDADRAVAVDEHGQIVRADFMTALLAVEMLERHPGAPILYDLRSSLVVKETIEAHGGRPLKIRVGHSFAKAVMRAEGAVFGGELSGHAYFADAYQSDSAILTMVEILNVLRKRGLPLSQLIAPFATKYESSGELNFHVDDKDATLAEVERVFGPGPDGRGGKVDHLDGVTVAFPDWWFNVRPSNTEPLLRLTAEALKPGTLAAHLATLTPILGRPDNS